MQVIALVDEFHSLNKIDTVKMHISHAAATKICAHVENISSKPIKLQK